MDLREPYPTIFDSFMTRQLFNKNTQKVQEIIIVFTLYKEFNYYNSNVIFINRKYLISKIKIRNCAVT